MVYQNCKFVRYFAHFFAQATRLALSDPIIAKPCDPEAITKFAARIKKVYFSAARLSKKAERRWLSLDGNTLFLMRGLH